MKVEILILAVVLMAAVTFCEDLSHEKKRGSDRNSCHPGTVCIKSASRKRPTSKDKHTNRIPNKNIPEPPNKTGLKKTSTSQPIIPKTSETLTLKAIENIPQNDSPIELSIMDSIKEKVINAAANKVGEVIANKVIDLIAEEVTGGDAKEDVENDVKQDVKGDIEENAKEDIEKDVEEDVKG